MGGFPGSDSGFSGGSRGDPGEVIRDRWGLAANWEDSRFRGEFFFASARFARDFRRRGLINLAGNSRVETQYLQRFEYIISGLFR